MYTEHLEEVLQIFKTIDQLKMLLDVLSPVSDMYAIDKKELVESSTQVRDEIQNSVLIKLNRLILECSGLTREFSNFSWDLLRIRYQLNSIVLHINSFMNRDDNNSEKLVNDCLLHVYNSQNIMHKYKFADFNAMSAEFAQDVED